MVLEKSQSCEQNINVSGSTYESFSCTINIYICLKIIEVNSFDVFLMFIFI